jgi:hypothetical protein
MSVAFKLFEIYDDLFLKLAGLIVNFRIRTESFNPEFGDDVLLFGD